MLKGLNFNYSVPFILFISLTGSSSLFAAMSAEDHHIEAFVAGGVGFSNLRNDKSVNINRFVVNDYDTNTETKFNGFWGGGVAYSFRDIYNAPFNLSVGVAGYGMDLGNVKGIEYPFINDDVYDTLNYRFTVKSASALAEARLFYTGCNKWQPYLLVGLGVAWNRLENYNEVPTNPALSAAPVISQFRDNTHAAFAYEVGAGVQRELYQDQKHHITYFASLDYRYINFGDGQLASFPAETTGDAIRIDNINTQALVLSLKATF